jgi:hypothetical protein
MAPNWHEFTAVDQDPAESTIVGKIGYSPLPRGPVRNANMWGGTGVGINGASPIEEQRAAWLFLVWATSPDTMLMGMKSDVGGGTPTRGSLYELPEVKKAMEPPLFILFRYVHLLDTIPGLIVAYLTFNLPFAIWIMNAFFTDLPPSLEEAAMVDGATRFQAFYRVALPLVTPGIVTTAILCLVFSWNDYAFAATFSGPNSQTLPIAAAQLNTQTGLNWGQLSAIGTIVVLPMMVVGLAVRRYLVRGLTLGAVTGE